MRASGFFLAASLLAFLPAFAGVITGVPGDKEIEGVKVAASAAVKVESRAYQMKLAGAGLRYKKIAFLKPNVYVGELFLEAPEKMVRTKEGALESLVQQKAVAMRLNFLRDVDADKVIGGFKDSLKENGVDLEAPMVKAFLGAVKEGGESKKGSTLVIVAEKMPGGKEAVSLENAAGKLTTYQGESGIMRTALSLWFGKIDDSGLESLRDEILGLKK